jgi:predicted metal-binding membrane protein
LRHERALIALTAALLAALGWAYVLHGMRMSMMEPPVAVLIAMWWLMMIAMMLPSATPAILLYAQVRRARGGEAIAHSWVFLAGYLAVWLLFSIVVALGQSLLAGSSMVIHTKAAQCAVLIGAGLYQLSPLKSVCISQCRSPGQFISRHWSGGWNGAIKLGTIHGVYCVGCCWMLMALLFVGGVMNLPWIIGLTILVAAEKLIPSRIAVQKISGVGLVLWGLARAFG